MHCRSHRLSAGSHTQHRLTAVPRKVVVRQWDGATPFSMFFGMKEENTMAQEIGEYLFIVFEFDRCGTIEYIGGQLEGYTSLRQVFSFIDYGKTYVIIG